MLTRWRRRRVLARAGDDDPTFRRLASELPLLAGLDREERRRLYRLSVLFLDEKDLQRAGGGVPAPELGLRIAALACLPVLNLGLDYYRGWTSIVLYPGGFVARHQEVDEAGVVHEVARPLVGEASELGPVVLAEDEVMEAGWGEGPNVVVHEMAHKLDMLTGEVNGLPPLHRGMARRRWSEAFGAAYGAHCRQVEAGVQTEIDPYAAQDPAEFFAVLSETFFELPEALVDAFPSVYRELQAFYRQDPLRRWARDP